MPQNLSANGLSSSFTPPGSSSNKDANSPPPRDNTGSPPQNSNWSFEEQFKQVRQVSSGFTDDAFWGTLHLIAWMTQTLVEFLRRQYQGIRFKTLLWRHTPELTLIVKSRNKSRLLRYIPRCRNINVVTRSYRRHIHQISLDDIQAVIINSEMLAWFRKSQLLGNYSWPTLGSGFNCGN